MKLKTKETIAFGIMIISILTIIGSVSFAYFTAMTDGNPQEVSGTTGVMKLTFADGDSGINAQLNFDESTTKKFTLKNTGTLDSTVKILWKDLINTYTLGSLTYTLFYSETENGTFTEIVGKTNVPISPNASSSALSAYITVPAGKTYYYKLRITLNYLDDVNQDADIDAVFNTQFEVADISTLNPIFKIKASSNGIKASFASPATTDEGVFEMADDYGTSYYFRGAVTNNYVKFANFYWRIIRINGDGSLRIIYDGDKGYENESNDLNRLTYTKKSFNTNYDDAKYVGWMFGGEQGEASKSKEEAQANTTSSSLKLLVDEWYKTNIKNQGLEDKVSDNVFCNDRTISDGPGYGKNNTNYSSTARLGNHYSTVQISPTLICPEKNDAFTVKDTKHGNGKLDYPIGLITGDEAVITGSVFSLENNKNFLYRGSMYWTMTPYYYNLYDIGALERYNSVFNAYAVTNENVGVAVVINLKPEYVRTLIGTGTMTDPYRASDVTP